MSHQLTNNPFSMTASTITAVTEHADGPMFDCSTSEPATQNEAVTVRKDTIQSLEDELRHYRDRARQLEQELNLVSNKGKLISQELDLFRQRRVVFWSDRFRNNFDAWNLMNANFQQLKDDSAMFNGDIKEFRLQPSYSLLRVASLNYSFTVGRAGLKGIYLAPVLDVPLEVGELCMRLFSAPDTLIASCTRSVKGMNGEEPVLFDFDPIADSDTVQLKMRVYVQGVDAPVRLFELRRYSLGGFGRLKCRPFAGFVF